MEPEHGGQPPAGAVPVVTAVVVTHNRPDDLRQCLTALQRQTAAVADTVVVDNGSSAATQRLLAEFPEVHVHRLHANGGGAGGFAAGLRFAQRFNPYWYWLMDDDCAPCPTALATMLATGERLGTNATAGIIPTVRWSDGRTMCGFLRTGEPANSRHADWGPFAGILLCRSACDAAGDIRGDFFIRHDDREYGLRLRRAGWHFLRCPDAIVEHPVYSQQRLSRRILRWTIQISDGPVWKEYYGVRNAIIVAAQDAPSGRAAIAVRGRAVKDELVSCARILLVDHTSWQRVRWRLRGLIDGLRGRTGMVAHPDHPRA